MPTNVKTYYETVDELHTTEMKKADKPWEDEWQKFLKMDMNQKEREKEKSYKKTDLPHAVQVDGDPAWMYFINRCADLGNLRCWFCDVDVPTIHTPWFTPRLFERMCIMDPELKKACRAVKDINDKAGLKKVEENLTRVLTTQLLSIIIKKFQCLKEGLAKYFAAKAQMGMYWEEDEAGFQALMKHLGYKKTIVESENVRWKIEDGSE